jgi:hypothetical protein
MAPKVHPQLEFKTARQRATEQPPAIDWVIGGLAAGGIVTELDGPHKSAGKTTFIAHAVRRKLDGKPFLGLASKPGPVVWLTEESWSTFQEALRVAGLLDRDDLYVLCREDALGAPWAEVARQARDLSIRIGARLLIGDTLSSLAGLKGDEENSSGAAMEAIRPVQEIAAAGVAVLVSRHERRAGGEVGDSGRGSTAFSGAVDMIFRLTRLGGEGRASMRRLDYIGRVRAVPEARIIELTEAGYVLVGSEANVRHREAERLLLDHVPAREEDAITLPSLWSGEGPLVGSALGKSTIREVAEALFQAGRLARKEINPRRHVWWCVFAAPVPTKHIGKKSGVEAESVDVFGAHTPLRSEHTPNTPDSDDSAPDIHPSPDHDPRRQTPGGTDPLHCPACGRVDYAPLPEDRRRCLACGEVWQRPLPLLNGSPNQTTLLDDFLAELDARAKKAGRE